MNLIPTSKTIF